MKDIKGVNKKYHLQGARRKPDTIKKIYKIDRRANSLGIAINSNEVMHKAIGMDKTLGNKNYNTLHRWCYNFFQDIAILLWDPYTLARN